MDIGVLCIISLSLSVLPSGKIIITIRSIRILFICKSGPKKKVRAFGHVLQGKGKGGMPPLPLQGVNRCQATHDAGCRCLVSPTAA